MDALPLEPAVAVLASMLLAVCVVLVVVAVRSRRTRAVADREVALARSETAELAARVEQLSEQVGRLDRPRADAAYVITDAGSATDDAGVGRPMARDSLVLSAAVGEPLVKAVALGAGVRRALSAESRHRIRFAVRQETRRSRKQRRREMRDAWLAHKRGGVAAGGAVGHDVADGAGPDRAARAARVA